MDAIMLPVKFMEIGYIFIPMLLIAYVLTLFVKNKMVKVIMYFLKAAAYFGLAFFMWKFYQDKAQIDIISAFTFIFCCFETCDNILSILLTPLEIHEKYEGELKTIEMIRRLK